MSHLICCFAVLLEASLWRVMSIDTPHSLFYVDCCPGQTNPDISEIVSCPSINQFISF